MTIEDEEVVLTSHNEIIDEFLTEYLDPIQLNYHKCDEDTMFTIDFISQMFTYVDEESDTETFDWDEAWQAMIDFAIALSRQRHFFLTTIVKYMAQVSMIKGEKSPDPFDSEILRMMLYPFLGTDVFPSYTKEPKLISAQRAKGLISFYNLMPTELQDSASEYLEIILGNTFGAQEFTVEVN